MRKEERWTDGWLFYRGDIPVPRPKDKGPVYMQSKTECALIGPAAYGYFDRPDPYGGNPTLHGGGWEAVTVPHDFIIDQDPNPNENNAHGYVSYCNGWYRRHFTLDPADRGRHVALHFEGIAGQSTIYINGCLLKRNFSSYHSFDVDLSDYVRFEEENVLAIYVNTERFEGWWYQGGGIYRNVTLTVTDPVFLDRYGIYAPARRLAPGRWEIPLELTIRSDDEEDRAMTALAVLTDRNGREVARAETGGTVPSRSRTVLRGTMAVSDPVLWDTETPTLYTVRVTVRTENGWEDDDRVRIGFRTVTLDPDRGLFLNGKPTFIRGVCCHQDYGLTGLAVPDNVARYKMERIRSMGANGFRTSHYQLSAAYLDAMDELGFLVMDETRWFGSSEEAMEELETLVLRDRNRPSVILWSTGNEEPYHTTEMGRRIHRAMARRIRSLDPDRFVTAAQSNDPTRSTIFADCDAIGINYNADQFEKVRAAYPDKPIFSSENCATGTTRDWNYPSDLQGHIRDRDRDTNSWFLAREGFWKFFRAHPYIFGSFQWAAVEHRGEAAWPAVCSKSGALDLFLQEKGAYYQNLSHWTQSPMVHIVPHWNFHGLEGQPIPVTVYTNCDELELLCNGTVLARKSIEPCGHGEFSVPYAPGTLEVRGYRKGVQVAADRRVTTGRPDRLTLKLDNRFRANGEDLALFTCQCVDEAGRPVPDGAVIVQFSAEEPAIIVGTGSDHCDHHRVGETWRRMYMGKIAVAVRPAKGQTAVTLTAISADCGGCMLTVEPNAD